MSLRVGLIGFGYWGPNLARNVKAIAGVELAAIADGRPERRAMASTFYPDARLCADGLELIDDSSLDAVVIATPVATHYALARRAMTRGKDVLVEKPLAASLVDAARLVDLAAREKRILMVDHVYVYSGPVRKIAQLIQDGELGDVRYYDAVRVNLGLFQNDVGVVWDLAAHDVSLLHFFLRRKFLTVQATGGCHLGGALENVAHITLGLEGDVQAHINVSWIAPVKIRRTIIVGDRKMLLYDDLQPDEKIKVYDRGVVFTSEHRDALLPEYRVGDMYAPRLDHKEALAAACAHFVDCVRHRQQPLTGGPEGLEVVTVLDAAQRSLRQRGRQIAL